VDAVTGQLVEGPSITVKTDALGLAEVSVWVLGRSTADHPAYIKLALTDVNDTQVGENLLTATATGSAGTVTLPSPFIAYGLPATPAKLLRVSPLQDDWMAALPNQYVGNVFVQPADPYDNPLSNLSVTFSVLPSVPSGQDAAIATNEELCPNAFVRSECPTASDSRTLLSAPEAVSVRVFAGSVSGVTYRIEAKLPDHPDLPAVQFQLTVPAPLYTQTCVILAPNAALAGQALTTPFTLVPYEITQVATGQYTTTRLSAPKSGYALTLTPIKGSAQIGTPLWETTALEYHVPITLSSIPEENRITFRYGTVTTSVCSGEFYAYGVKGQTTVSYPVLVNPEEKLSANLGLSFKVDPVEANVTTAAIDLYEDQALHLSLSGKNNQAVIPTGQDFLLEQPYSLKLRFQVPSRTITLSNTTGYQALPILETPGEPFIIGRVELWDLLRQRLLQGGVTDGVTPLILRLIVKQNRQALPDLTWGLIDPQLGGNTVGLGSYVDTAGSPIPSPTVVFDANGVAEAIYQVPDSFVRWGAGPAIEDQDKAQPERSVQITLNGQTQGVPQIRLTRPPVVLVHGVWGGPKTTWGTFEGQLNDKLQFAIVKADYSQDPYNNAGPFSQNYSVIGEYVGQALKEIKKDQLAATKVDLITHSMGGLLVREYCRQESLSGRDCSTQIHKLITLDTPHTGSELANLVVATHAQPESECYSVLLELERRGRLIWVDPQRTILQGGLIDLTVGSSALQALASAPVPVPWTAVVGTAQIGLQPFLFAYDSDLNKLWQGLWLYCNKVPDSSFFEFFGLLDTVFPGDNDRIVSALSQLGPATDLREISGVDHTTVLQEGETVQRVKEILEGQP
jgi:pimeloyl-ACP methyl ester carboxylesterase